MLVKSKYAKRDFPFSPSGSPIQMKYREALCEDGAFGLVEDGEVNTDELINSQKDACMIENIMKRFAPGEPLNVIEGLSMDLAGVPDNPIDFYNAFNRARVAFNSLSVEDRQRIGDFSQFLEAALGSIAPQREEKTFEPAQNEVKSDV